MASKLYDVLIIGGGPAGLSMATTLARQAYSVLLFDSREYRNELANHMHTVPGFDHADPAEFRAKARKDLQARYPMVEFRDAKVNTARKDEEHGVFVLEDAEGVVTRGKKLGLATGVREIFDGEPEGFEQCWAKGIFHCMFCHGFEERGVESVGIIATGVCANAMVLGHVVPMAKRFASRAVVYTNGNPSLLEAAKPLFKSSKISFDDRKIASYALVDGGPAVRITFADGSSKVEGFCSNQPQMAQRSDFAAQLGLEMADGGLDIKTSPPFNATSLKGCYAMGDAATMMKNVMSALHMGGFAGAGSVMELQHELDAADEL